MNHAVFLSAVQEEIARLQQIQALLESESSTVGTEGKRRGRPPGSTDEQPTLVKQPRMMSEAGRESIAAAQKKRWAAKKKAEIAAAATTRTRKDALSPKPAAPAKKAVPKPVPAKKTSASTAAIPPKKTSSRQPSTSTAAVAAASAKNASKLARKSGATNPTTTVESAAGKKAVSANKSAGTQVGQRKLSKPARVGASKPPEESTRTEAVEAQPIAPAKVAAYPETAETGSEE